MSTNRKFDQQCVPVFVGRDGSEPHSRRILHLPSAIWVVWGRRIGGELQDGSNGLGRTLRYFGHAFPNGPLGSFAVANTEQVCPHA